MPAMAGRHGWYGLLFTDLSAGPATERHARRDNVRARHVATDRDVARLALLAFVSD